ncbi:hypothetical protein RHGRI_006713 [Rhododendron griersonianum]|uniref:Ankyrin repeat family protein n=1 Tax=Rhododendron griersonianum TaxID=479676 RepID=A0AAV6KU79_9ERIC|nr:hypothetical protein RHGRI_006713 [Rhododendron griersonianum]
MTPQDVVDLSNIQGATALHFAAMVDNMEGAKMLVKKNSDLPNFVNLFEETPLQWAAWYGHKEMVLYLKEVTREDILLADDDRGASFLCHLTRSQHYDIVLTLLHLKPKLACLEPNPLGVIVEQHSSFKSRNSSNFWQSLIYSVPMKSEGIANLHKGGGGGRGRGDIESQLANCCLSGLAITILRQRLHFMIWDVAEKLDDFAVPHVKRIREKKERQHHALELVKFICMEVAKSNLSQVERIFKPALRNAAHVGIPEIIEEIVLSQPLALSFTFPNGLNIITYAIMYRRERVFNLIYQIGGGGRLLYDRDDDSMNGLHLAARLRREQQINLKASATGVVLQMQREVQWFKFSALRVFALGVVPGGGDGGFLHGGVEGRSEDLACAAIDGGVLTSDRFWDLRVGGFTVFGCFAAASCLRRLRSTPPLLMFISSADFIAAFSFLPSLLRAGRRSTCWGFRFRLTARPVRRVVGCLVRASPPVFLLRSLGFLA